MAPSSPSSSSSSSRARFWQAVEWVQQRSLRAASRSEGLSALAARLTAVVPDLGAQYTTFAVTSDTAQYKVRAQHAFQVQMAIDALERVDASRDRSSGPMTVVDIGDSAGTHILYLKAMLQSHRTLAGSVGRWLSVNLDPVAIDKIIDRGLEAVLVRAEELHRTLGIRVDLFMSFEMLEHLTDPITFLDSLSRTGSADWLVITVPYRRRSQMGLHHIRNGVKRQVGPENTHMFELSPEDWRLACQQGGWRVEAERTYLQYPRAGLWRVTQPLWRRLDFEGFYGAILRRDRSWAECYEDGGPASGPQEGK